LNYLKKKIEKFMCNTKNAQWTNFFPIDVYYILEYDGIKYYQNIRFKVQFSKFSNFQVGVEIVLHWLYFINWA